MLGDLPAARIDHGSAHPFLAYLERSPKKVSGPTQDFGMATVGRLPVPILHVVQ